MYNGFIGSMLAPPFHTKILLPINLSYSALIQFKNPTLSLHIFEHIHTDRQSLLLDLISQRSPMGEQ